MSRKGLAAICWVNFFWSLSTLMLVSTVSIYHESVLHFSKSSIGSIRGYTILAMYGTKFLVGILIDMYRNHRLFLILGSLFSIFAKSSFAFLHHPFSISLVSIGERMVKSMRAMPTDAYISLIQKDSELSYGFALKQASYPLGAAVGCFVATFILYLTQNDFRLLYLLAGIPNILALGIILAYIKIPKDLQVKKTAFQWGKIREIPIDVWLILLCAFLISLSRPNELFMGHRFYESGVSIMWIPLIYVFYDLPFSLTSFFASRFYDRYRWQTIILLSVLFLALANLLFFISAYQPILLTGAVFFGMYVGLSQGLTLSLISRNSPREIHGTIFAIYYTIFGVGLFMNSRMLGFLGHWFETWRAGFGASACINVFLLLFFYIFLPKIKLKHAGN